jgi:hypothetical protein
MQRRYTMGFAPGFDDEPAKTAEPSQARFLILYGVFVSALLCAATLALCVAFPAAR